MIFGFTFAWIGTPDVIPGLVSALAKRSDLTPINVVLGVSWLRENVDWWPEWGGFAICAFLLLIPARGALGYGIATLAGMAAIPNLWRHYLGTVVFGGVLMWRGLNDLRRDENAKLQSAAARPPTGAPPGDLAHDDDRARASGPQR